MWAKIILVLVKIAKGGGRFTGWIGANSKRLLDLVKNEGFWKMLAALGFGTGTAATVGLTWYSIFGGSPATAAQVVGECLTELKIPPTTPIANLTDSQMEAVGRCIAKALGRPEAADEIIAMMSSSDLAVGDATLGAVGSLGLGDVDSLLLAVAAVGQHSRRVAELGGIRFDAVPDFIASIRYLINSTDSVLRKTVEIAQLDEIPRSY